MPSDKKEKFLQEVMSYVKFPFDRDDIKQELDNHLCDRISEYTGQGLEPQDAQDLAVKNMGDAKEIGVNLNNEHNPLIGWLWKITNVLVALALAVSSLYIGFPLLVELFPGSSLADIPQSAIIYKVDVDQRVRMDDQVINFKKVIYEVNGDMNILYDYYETNIWGMNRSFNFVEIRDNLGNIYVDGGGVQRRGFFKTKAVTTFENFSKKADTLIINYDKYNRNFRIEIPLPAGEAHE